MTTKARYYIRWLGRPLCDHMGCEAGRKLCEAADVQSCSYTRRRDAIAAMRRLEARAAGYAGATSLATGECPRVADLAA